MLVQTPSRAQYGFTMVELMIVTVVIGILGALALPVYQGYSNRARMSEVVLALSVCRNHVSDAYTAASSLPSANSWGCEASVGQGTKYVKKIETDDVGVVMATVTGFNDVKLDDRVLTMVPYADSRVTQPMNATHLGKQVAAWRCLPAAVNGVPRSSVPASCRD